MELRIERGGEGGGVGEGTLSGAESTGGRSGRVREMQWQARWFAGEFGREFVSTDGEQIRVVQFGVWNRSAGPDFVEAAVSLNGGEPRVGAIELDMEAADWERHGHGLNPDYARVVLHVVVFRGSRDSVFFTRTLEHSRVPAVVLSGEFNGREETADAHVLARPGRCARWLAYGGPQEVERILTEAAKVRFFRKASMLRRLQEAHGFCEALYQGVAGALGYCGNELPFTLISQRLPVGLLMNSTSWRDVDALLFGVAGWIPKPSLMGLDERARIYARELWDGWWPHRVSHGRSELGSHLWRLSGQRPGNHPQRRLAALGALVRVWRLVLRLCRGRDWSGLRKVLMGMRHPFWNERWTFKSTSKRGVVCLIGRERVDELMSNVFYPITEDWGAMERCSVRRSGGLNKRCRIALARLFPRDPTLVMGLFGRALFRQGLLELYEGYCRSDASDCVRCVFPEQLQQRVLGGARDEGSGGVGVENNLQNRAF